LRGNLKEIFWELNPVNHFLVEEELCRRPRKGIPFKVKLENSKIYML